MAYILTYYPHKCIWSNWGMWHAHCSWGEYLLLTCIWQYYGKLKIHVLVWFGQGANSAYAIRLWQCFHHHPALAPGNVIHHLCTAFLATSLMAANSYLAFILTYIPYIFIWDNVGIWLTKWYLSRIFIAVTYMAVAWYIKSCILCLLLICAVMLCLYVDYSSSAV